MSKEVADKLKARREQYERNLAKALGPFLARGVRVEDVDPVDGAFSLKCRSTGKVVGFSPVGDDHTYLDVRDADGNPTYASDPLP